MEFTPDSTTEMDDVPVHAVHPPDEAVIVAVPDCTPVAIPEVCPIDTVASVIKGSGRRHLECLIHIEGQSRRSNGNSGQRWIHEKTPAANRQGQGCKRRKGADQPEFLLRG